MYLNAVSIYNFLSRLVDAAFTHKEDENIFCDDKVLLLLITFTSLSYSDYQI